VPDPQLTRRLAAILSADVAGYTRLLAADETATIRALSDMRERMAVSVGRHGGRVVDSPGDNVLAEFSAAQDAMLAGIEIQRVMEDRDVALAPERRMHLRIGLHLGDIAVEGERIYGDGVNVAARLEALADLGGICLSAAIHDNVASRLDLAFEDIGEQTLKNFPRPVRAFKLGGGSAAPKLAAPFEPPPDRPSLVVLPFANVSGDSEQEFFADGMSEDLITELASVGGLFVIGRGTSFAYRGRSVDARALGRELGVRHVVEGSVRRSGSRVRITARLSDTRTGQEVWSTRYDRELGDVFALQDEVVGGVVTELRRALGAVIDHSPRELQVRPDVWALLVQGRSHLDLNTPESVAKSRELLNRCVELDPKFAPGWTELARTESRLHLLGAEGEDYLAQGFAHARHALELDPDESVAHATLAELHAMRGDHEAAVSAVQHSVELAPGRADLRLSLATQLNFAARSGEAIPILRNLPRLDPALRYMHLFQLGICYRRLGRSDEAIAKFRESRTANPDFFGAPMQLAALHAQLGEMNQARAALAEVLRLRPDFSVATVPRLPSGREWLIANLRKAGLREH